jgi:hypothetical protein
MTNEAFAMDIRLAKSAWITGKITDKNVIINDLNGLYRNMFADRSWKKVSSADSKIISLTTQVRDLKKQLGNSDRPKGPGKQAKDLKTPTKPGKEVGKNWWYIKVRDTLECPNTGVTLKWCPHHGTGAYMPEDHNHKEWFDKKKRRQEKYKEQRAERAAKCVKLSDGDISKTPDKKVKDEKHPNKLQLSSAICQSLVTQCSI